MVQATLASMRHYCPNVPICLTVDGDFDVSDLERAYGAIVLRISELPSAEMRKLIGGNPRAKLAALWEGPFDFFVWLDADAIVWGDFTSLVRQDLDFQIFGNDGPVPPDTSEIPSWLLHYYFDPVKLRRFDPEFIWQGQSYFCDGTFACKRNVIPFHKWAQAISWGAKEPGLWPKDFYSMPFFNYLVHSMSQRGELIVGSADLQYIPEHHGNEELVQDCASAGWHFPKSIHRPFVAHFCGRKPLVVDRKAYSHPFTIARLEHHRSQHSEFGAWLALFNEERSLQIGRIKRRFRRLC